MEEEKNTENCQTIKGTWSHKNKKIQSNQKTQDIPGILSKFSQSSNHPKCKWNEVPTEKAQSVRMDEQDELHLPADSSQLQRQNRGSK